MEYEVKRYERDAETMLAPPELKAIHPLGKSPVVEDNGQVLAESGAIMETLADRYGGGKLARPHGSPSRHDYIYWLHYAEGSAMPPLLLKLFVDRIAAAKIPFFVKPIVRQIRAACDPGVHRASAAAPSGLHGERPYAPYLVRRRRVLGGGHSTQLSARSRRRVAPASTKAVRSSWTTSVASIRDPPIGAPSSAVGRTTTFEVLRCLGTLRLAYLCAGSPDWSEGV